MFLSIFYLKNDIKHCRVPNRGEIINDKNLLLEDIDKKFFYYFKENNNYYGFDIRELYYIIKNEKLPKNPYTNNKISSKNIKQVKRIIKRNKIKLNNLNSPLSGQNLISSLNAELYTKINFYSGCFIDIENLLKIDKIYQIYFLQLLANTRFVYNEDIEYFIDKNMKKTDIRVELLKFLIELINMCRRKKEFCFIISEAFKGFYQENDVNNINNVNEVDSDEVDSDVVNEVDSSDVVNGVDSDVVNELDSGGVDSSDVVNGVDSDVVNELDSGGVDSDGVDSDGVDSDGVDSDEVDSDVVNEVDSGGEDSDIVNEVGI
jgi:hypothetical protein